MTRRIVFSIVLALGLAFLVAFEVGPVAAQDDRDPTTTSTSPSTSTSTTSTSTPSTTTTVESEYAPIGGPEGDVIEPSPWEELRPRLLVGIPLVVALGIGAVVVVRSQLRRTDRAA